MVKLNQPQSGPGEIDRRIDELRDEMTIEEKAAQLGSVNADRLLDDKGNLDTKKVDTHLSQGIGHLTRIGGEGALPPRKAAKTVNELQQYLREETRLGIPAIPHEECLSGYMGPQGTMFPQMLGVANTWSPDLLESITTTIRDELEAIGTVQALSPVLDVARDLRWGRVEETFGEDPYLIASMASGYVDGLQGDGEGVDATLKHFAAHGSSAGGKNRSSVNIGPRELREIHLFPFEAVIQESDAASIMNAYHDIDGVPCASSKWLLTDLLRGELGFDGVVVSDYYSVEFLKSEHGVAANKREAGVSAIEAGIDVELPFSDCYGNNLVEAVERGELSESVLDESVDRVLRAKFEAGLFDDATVDPGQVARVFDSDVNRDLARRAARESITLLENDGLLPLDGDDLDSVAVVGPKANDDQELLGDYAYAAHYPEEEVELDATTPLDAFESRAQDSEFDIEYARGCTTSGPSTESFREAKSAANDADLAVAFVGARSAVDLEESDDIKANRANVPTSGEGCDVVDLGLPGVQQDLLQTLNSTDTPLVVVIVSGKPHAIDWIAREIPAVLHSWLPGEEGGGAIADVLFGDYNPSGHLPISVPKSVGQLPVHYNRKANTASEEYVYTDSDPLYPFGYGLSYTEFEYGSLSISESTLPPAGTLEASIAVTNSGDRAGYEVVQLYARSENPSLARPVQELVGFERVHLDPGETKHVTFEFGATQLAFHDTAMNLVVEEGPYELRVGRSAEDIVSTASFDVLNSKPVPRTGRRYFTKTTVESSE